MEATVHRPGEGEQIGGPTTVTIKVTGEETDGSSISARWSRSRAFPDRLGMCTSTCTTCSMSLTAH
jgi:hypothetical protein